MCGGRGEGGELRQAWCSFNTRRGWAPMAASFWAGVDVPDTGCKRRSAACGRWSRSPGPVMRQAIQPEKRRRCEVLRGVGGLRHPHFPPQPHGTQREPTRRLRASHGAAPAARHQASFSILARISGWRPAPPVSCRVSCSESRRADEGKGRARAGGGRGSQKRTAARERGHESEMTRLRSKSAVGDDDQRNDGAMVTKGTTTALACS